MGLYFLPITLITTTIIASFGQLLFTLTPEQKTSVRRLENEAKKS